MASSPDNMPTHYETQQTTTARTTSVDRTYIATVPGILKITEAVVSFIVFICGAASVMGSMGFLVFTGIAAFIVIGLLFLVRLFTLYDKLPAAIPWTLIAFIIYCVFSLFYLISGCLAAACAPYFNSCGAGAFFSFLALVLFAVDTFFHFRTWQSGSPPGPTVQATTTVTSVETTAHY